LGNLNPDFGKLKFGFGKTYIPIRKILNPDLKNTHKIKLSAG
jgi:hypothetical protein